MNRREFLQCAVVPVSGASVTQTGFALNEEQLKYLATAPDFVDKAPSYLGEHAPITPGFTLDGNQAQYRRIIRLKAYSEARCLITILSSNNSLHPLRKRGHF